MVISSCAKEKMNQPNEETFLYYKNYSINGANELNAFGVPLNSQISISFSESVDATSVASAIQLSGRAASQVNLNYNLSNNDSTINISFENDLPALERFVLDISQSLKSKAGHPLVLDFASSFHTVIDSTIKFPLITDENLLTKIQEQTFKYFWDYGHPVSGMARERNTSGDLVTTGGTGFGIMSILVAIERGFITKDEGLGRILKIVDFLDNKASKYHGAFAHWLNGVTGETIPFSSKDNGGDLVETSLLIAGLICASEYFNSQDTEEEKLRSIVKRLWKAVEWDWYTRGGRDVLFWHWSPNFKWDMNLQIRGWNESLITYVLAASSPTHPVKASVYHQGWANNGNMRNGREFYGISLPLGPDLGGSLLFSHYSFLGLNPFKLKDSYADYSLQNVNHSLINNRYCIANPRKYYGYSEDCWGLTASDTRNGYTAHSPTNDRGVITPTAAISSLPYTPEESMKAIRFFYYVLGDKLFRQYGFIDAFSLHDIWFADSFLAIDQGPIIIMIENYRSQLIWNTMMKNEDIIVGLKMLDFEIN